MLAAAKAPIISLLTDFGTRDHYAAVMKAVIASICPAARTLDITHEVEPFQIAQGAYLLSQSWRWFPSGTVHIAVVDPGVGSDRRALAVESEGHRFVLPDNGLLALIGVQQPAARQIQNPAVMLTPLSRTFHGRDIFAPAAAYLACGFPFADLGPLIEDWVRLLPPASQVLHIDRFGNVITSLRADDHPLSVLYLNTTTISRRANNYASAPDAKLFLIAGSGGYLEISEREGSAAARIGCRVGDPIKVLTADRS